MAMIDLQQIINFDYIVGNQFAMTFRPVIDPVLPWRDELLVTARNIENLAGDRPIILCMSGGVDGECMALSFLKAEIPFQVLICEHLAGTNAHDTISAREFCGKNNIDPIIFNVDHEEFFTKGVDRYIEQGYKSVKLFRYFQLLLLDKVKSLGGCAVLGGGDQMYYRDGEQIVLKYSPDFTNSLEWCKNNNEIHFPYFYKQNSNVFAAYMQIDLIDFLLDKPKYFNDGWSVSAEKSLVYRSIWPELKRRRKFTGFEKIIDFRNNIQQKLSDKFPEIQDIIIPVSEVRRQLHI